jgi:hypothetical protein
MDALQSVIPVILGLTERAQSGPLKVQPLTFDSIWIVFFILNKEKIITSVM